MNLRALGVALGVGLGVALIAPGTAEARHRHDRHCHDRHGGGVVYYYDSAPRYGHGYGYRDRYDYDDDYRYERRHRARRYYDRHYGYYDRDDRYSHRHDRRAPRVIVHFHGGRRCSRSHGGVWLRW